MSEITIQRFDGWQIICPHCGHVEYVCGEEIAFNPEYDETHIVQCEKCKEDFEAVIG